ncbi:D-alanyl-D-alanine carboxypeptidase [Antarcticimicrobium luteum]|uniref:D-alanyl-D-alanine carboxypeptidase n=2 Tax=Antarcticimicrobium luteum TaxID=2547397 RepID=A0A4V3ARV9_9RHOB|nr:D-alanyl-D-alanine carboxypeptidase family protein [Antarcticimicrobium luteum]TDK48137.1 D-alanyl-D-alanine carboxypeptidase [Antarcticimicrobium luteum]
MVGLTAAPARAAPYAAMVMDARTGEVLHARNADTRLHPASLTKMMTLYIAFEAVRNGEISMDTMVRVSQNAAAEPPSKLGLKAGQKIALRYLVRAAAVKSANDAATAIGEAISGSEAAFARRMTRTAKALGMTRTTFRNAHGLTENGHLSTAHDMTILGRHLLYDFPEYYNLFSRKSTSAGIKTVTSHNRILNTYKGADGIKTGYTRAAGFNLVASAQRGDERVIATVFGGKSSSSRNAKVAELLDLGFQRAPSRAPVRKPPPPAYAANVEEGAPTGRMVRLVGAVTSSPRPMARPGDGAVLIAKVDDADAAVIAAAVAEAMATAVPLSETVETTAIETAAVTETATGADRVSNTTVAPVEVPRPALRPQDLVEDLVEVSQPVPEEDQEIVTRLSTSGERHWGINVGRYTSRYQAEKTLLRTALSEMETLDGTLRKVVRSKKGFDANFMGMTEETADLACRRLMARNVTCNVLGPSS